MRSLVSVHSLQSIGTKKLPPYLQPTVPSVFTLEITPNCRHHCVGCGNVFTHSGREMGVADWADIVERLRPYARALRITGGEPTLYRQFERMMKIVDDLRIPFVIFTNGDWADPQSILQILGRCANLRGILVSLHAVDAKSYREFTGVDTFASVTENIQRATAAGLWVATNTLLLTTTYQRITEIANLAFSLGVSTVSFGRYYGPPLPSLSLAVSQLGKTLVQIAELRRQEPRIVLSNCVPACFLPGVDFGERGCTSGFTHCTIGPQGDVRPCTHTPLTLGYIQESDIVTLWRSFELDQWRQQIPSSCLTCAALSRCRGGCRATAQQLGLAQDPLMGRPLVELEQESIVELYAYDHPRLSCSVESTSYGYALNGTGKFVTLSHHSGPILQALDGRFTMQQIQEKFGLAGLQLVGGLLHQGLIVLRGYEC